MNRRTTVLVLVSAALILLVVLVSSYIRRYRLGALAPAQLSFKKIVAPQPLVDDCTRLQRALERSSRESEESTTPLTQDEIAIYQTIILERTSNGTERLNVSDRTYPFGETLGGANCDCLSGIDSDSYVRASRSFHVLGHEILPGKRMHLVDANTQTTIVRDNDPDNRGQHGKTLKRALDDAFDNGLFSLSEVAFDDAQRRALVSYSFVCGQLCGSGRTLLLEKIEGQWKISNRTCGGWIS